MIGITDEKASKYFIVLLPWSAVRAVAAAGCACARAEWNRGEKKVRFKMEPSRPKHCKARL